MIMIILNNKNMENNTVTLSLELYNELRDFKENIDNNHVIIISSNNYSFSSRRVIITTNEAIEEISKTNKDLQELIDTEKRYNTNQINEIKKMSLWEFLKWRKK